MASGKFVAYYRVSTKKQGLGLDAQKEIVARYLNGGEWTMIAEFSEKESGKHSNRVELQNALAMCKKEGAKLVIAKLDRLSRNVAFIAALMESGVEFVCCDNPHATKFSLHIFAALAEQERDFISSRTKDGLKALKARGVTKKGNAVALGGDRGKLDLARGARSDNARTYAAQIMPMIERIKGQGKTSMRAIAEELTYWKVKTPRGSVEWTAMQVSRVMQYAA